MLIQKEKPEKAFRAAGGSQTSSTKCGESNMSYSGSGLPIWSTNDLDPKFPVTGRSLSQTSNAYHHHLLNTNYCPRELQYRLLPERATNRQPRCPQNRRSRTLLSPLCACTCIREYIYACMRACLHTYIHTYMHAWIHTYMLHSFVHSYIHIYIHACMWMIHSCMHAYIHHTSHTEGHRIDVRNQHTHTHTPRPRLGRLRSGIL